MFTFKKICLYTCIILLIISLYNDFTKGSNSSSQNEQNKDNFIIKNDVKVVVLKVSRGETILSISERINQDKLINKSIDEIIADFKVVNPDTNVHDLANDTFYYFPLYD